MNAACISTERNLTSMPARYQWTCQKGCTVSDYMLKALPFPTEFVDGGPKE